MNNEVEITAKFCHPYMNFGEEDGCSNVVLKIPQIEVVKLQSVEVQNSPQLGEFDMGLFSYGLGLVLMFYVISYGLGQMIKMVR
ncbi:hypothetical protein [Lonepinella koalarum]